MAERVETGPKAHDRSEYETAVAAFSETREVWRQLGDRRGEASALMDLGVAHQRMGNLADAQLAYEEALELFDAMGDDTGKATVMGNLATLMKRRGAADQAEALLQKAADMFYELGKDDYEADTLRLLAQVQLQRGAYLDSLMTYNRALARMSQLTGAQKFLRALIKVFLGIIGVR